MAMRSVRSFRDLIVWQRAMELALAVYELTREFPKEEIYGLTREFPGDERYGLTSQI